VDNAFGGITPLRSLAANYVSENGAADFNMGQDMGDVSSAAIGAMMVEGGGGAAVGGVTVSATGVGAVVGAPTALAGVAVAAEGVILTAAGTANLASQKGRLNAEGKNEGSFGAQQDTKSQNSNQGLRNAKEQNGIPRSQQPETTIKPNTPADDKAGLDSRNVKQYEYTNSKGEKIVIRQDKPASYGQGGVGDQGPHYNAGNEGGKLTQHHYFDIFNYGGK